MTNFDRADEEAARWEPEEVGSSGKIAQRFEPPLYRVSQGVAHCSSWSRLGCREEDQRMRTDRVNSNKQVSWKCSPEVWWQVLSFFLFFLIFIFISLFIFSFIFISWRLITLQYCSGFCHTMTWISHWFTCVPHPDPPSRLPPIPLGLPSSPALSTCLMHPTWAGA